jgi:hypothetical protein
MIEQTVAHWTPPPSEPVRTEVFCAERDGLDGALDRIVIEFAVLEEGGEGWPSRERVADCLDQ